MTFAQETTNLVATATDLHREGRITTRDLRDITIELEDNAAAIRGVREFLAAR